MGQEGVMDYRYMRIIVMFDLPTGTKEERRKATQFRKFLLDDGYSMLQYSVYARLCPNRDNANKHLARLEYKKPVTGSVRAIMVTENQFASMQVIVGTKTLQERKVRVEQLSFF